MSAGNNRTNEELAERLRQIAEHQAMDYQSPHVAMTLNEAADALTSRAAVPDAATEALLKRAEEAEAQSAEDRVEWQQMKERASQRFNAYQQKKRELRQMEIRAEKAEAERDAALAAVERVQETLSLHNPNGRLVKEVLAALDGAPEPEAWHYGRSRMGTRLEDECPCEKQPCGLVTLADAETADCGQHAVKYSKTMRQSHSSSNCPGKPHDEHVKVTECWPMDCIEGDCDHRDEFGEPEGLESCPRTPMEVCVECMASRGAGRDPERWEEHLDQWPCSKTVRLPVEGESKP